MFKYFLMSHLLFSQNHDSSKILTFCSVQCEKKIIRLVITEYLLHLGIQKYPQEQFFSFNALTTYLTILND